MVCENLIFELIGVGMFEIEDGLGFYEVICYFIEKLDEVGFVLLMVMYVMCEFIVFEVL